MIVINDLCGDEDDRYGVEEYLKKALQEIIFKRLSDHSSFNDPVEIITKQLEDIFKSMLPEVQDPQIESHLGEDGKIYTTFLVPEWLAEQMKEEGMLDIDKA